MEGVGREGSRGGGLAPASCLRSKDESADFRGCSNWQPAYLVDDGPQTEEDRGTAAHPSIHTNPHAYTYCLLLPSCIPLNQIQILSASQSRNWQTKPHKRTIAYLAMWALAVVSMLTTTGQVSAPHTCTPSPIIDRHPSLASELLVLVHTFFSPFCFSLNDGHSTRSTDATLRGQHLCSRPVSLCPRPQSTPAC